MLKVEILFDEEKINEVGEYTPESIYKAVKDSFAAFDLPQVPTIDNTLVFHDRGRSVDFGGIWKVINTLLDADWCNPYLIKCKWYSDEEYENGKIYSENVLELFNELDNKINGIK